MRPVLWFIALTYAGSYMGALAIHLTGGRASELVTPIGLFSMLLPGLAAVIVRRRFGAKGRSIDWRALPLGYSLLAPLVPVAVTAAAALAYLGATSQLHVAAWLTPNAQGLLLPGPDARFGTQPFPPSDLPVKIVVNLLVNFILLCLFATGEEAGWRGFLQPQLEERASVKRAAVLTAVIWAGWHTGFHLAGVHFPRHVLLVGALLAGPAMLIGSGIFFGWLYARTRSLWPVVLCHASANAWSQFALRFLDVPTSSEAGLLVAIALAFLALGVGVLVAAPWHTRVELARRASATP